MSTKHTPGPWQAIQHSWSDTSVVSATGTVCRMSIYDEATEETQAKLEARDAANARLIAAAPAGVAFAQWIADRHPAGSVEGDKAREFIAKATGAQP